MKYFWTFFWTFLLIQMLSYVAGSMMGVTYDFQSSAILGVIATILIYFVPAILPNDAEQQGSH